MTLHRLEVFFAVAQRLNITKVSRELHVSQPAISQEIKRLEENLGVKLIRKYRRGIELTDAGPDLRRDMERILPELSALKTKVSFAHNERKPYAESIYLPLGTLVCLASPDQPPIGIVLPPRC